MNFGIVFLIFIGVLLVVGLIVDVIARIRGKKVNLERDKSKSKNKTGDIYSTSLKQDRNNNLF